MGVFEAAAPQTLREIRGCAGRAHPRSSSTDTTCSAVRSATCWWTICANASRRWTTAAWEAFRGPGGGFWRDLEIHHPGIDSLRLPAQVAAAWKQRLRTKQKTIVTGTGEKVTVDVQRLNYRECLIPIRAFYLDLAQWAVDDPGRWAQWAVPCPINEEEINRRKLKRHRKSRMDARTRERLPVLPTLVRTVNEQRKNAGAVLQAARQTQPGRDLHRSRADADPLRYHAPEPAGRSGRTTPAPASDATSNAKKTTPSGPGRSLKSCA